MTFYRENGLAVRVAKNRDRVFANTQNDATDWLPCQVGGSLTVSVNKGYLSSPIATNLSLQMITMSDFPNAVVVLERKLATQMDDEAQLVDMFSQTNVFANVVVQQPGYYRLRIREISVLNDPTGVIMELSVYARPKAT